MVLSFKILITVAQCIIFGSRYKFQLLESKSTQGNMFWKSKFQMLITIFSMKGASLLIR
jgi:hypothetical protein